MLNVWNLSAKRSKGKFITINNNNKYSIASRINRKTKQNKTSRFQLRQTDRQSSQTNAIALEKRALQRLNRLSRLFSWAYCSCCCLAEGSGTRQLKWVLVKWFINGILWSKCVCVCVCVCQVSDRRMKLETLYIAPRIFSQFRGWVQLILSIFKDNWVGVGAKYRCVDKKQKKQK